MFCSIFKKKKKITPPSEYTYTIHIKNNEEQHKYLSELEKYDIEFRISPNNSYRSFSDYFSFVVDKKYKEKVDRILRDMNDPILVDDRQIYNNFLISTEGLSSPTLLIKINISVLLVFMTVLKQYN